MDKVALQAEQVFQNLEHAWIAVNIGLEKLTASMEGESNTFTLHPLQLKALADMKAQTDERLSILVANHNADHKGDEAMQIDIEPVQAKLAWQHVRQLEKQNAYLEQEAKKAVKQRGDAVRKARGLMKTADEIESTQVALEEKETELLQKQIENEELKADAEARQLLADEAEKKIAEEKARVLEMKKQADLAQKRSLKAQLKLKKKYGEKEIEDAMGDDMLDEGEEQKQGDQPQAKKAKAQKSEADIEKDVCEFVVYCYKGVSGQKQIKTAEQQIEELKMILYEGFQKLGVPQPVNLMSEEACYTEVDVIQKVTEGFSSMNLLLKFRIGALCNQIQVIATGMMAWRSKEYKGQVYSNVNDYLAVRFNTNRTDVYACMKWYHHVCTYPPMIAGNKPWSWISKNMTKLHNACEYFTKHGNSFAGN